MDSPNQPGEHRLQRGAFCISIDVELAWGYWDCLSPAYLAQCSRLDRTVIQELVQLFARHEVSATWVVVGALLDRDSARPEGAEAVWFAPDVLESIVRAPHAQEIGSHSFAHIDFASAPAGAARADLAHAREIHRAHGLDFTSFVFPRNRVGHLAELAQHGIKVFRGPDRGAIHTAGRLAGRVGRRVANYVDKLIPISPAVVHPIAHPEGIVELPGSLLLMGRDGVRRLVPPRALTAKATRGLRRAAREGGVFHLWFHPSNFHAETTTQLAILDAILTAATELRRTGELDIVPMGHFAYLAGSPS